jgi:hypothetical protein
MKNLLRTILFAFLLAGAAGLLSGCATDDTGPDAQGWNTGRNFGDYSNPFPSRLNQGR